MRAEAFPTDIPVLFSSQSHENQDIYQKAFDIIERYFGTEEDDIGLAPQVRH